MCVEYERDFGRYSAVVDTARLRVYTKSSLTMRVQAHGGSSIGVGARKARSLGLRKPLKFLALEGEMLEALGVNLEDFEISWVKNSCLGVDLEDF